MEILSKEILKRQVRELQLEYVRTTAEMKREVRAGRTIRLEQLLHARHEILLSICHRQGKLMDVLENEAKFASAVEVKAAKAA